jgi:hypothetical protein
MYMYMYMYAKNQFLCVVVLPCAYVHEYFPSTEEAQNSDEDKDRLSKVTHTYQSERKAEPAGLGATLTLEMETEQNRDQRGVVEKAQNLNQVWALGTTCSNPL